MNPITFAVKIMLKYDLIFYGGRFWYCQNGFYRPAEMEIRNFLQTELANDFSSNYVKQIFYVLESRVYKETVESDPGWINFKNGIYNWMYNRFHPHETDIFEPTSKLRFMNQISVNFNAGASCPKIQKFLPEVMNKEDQEVLLQFLGYCLVTTTRFEKAIMFIGDGANGKSTLLKLIIALIGDENTSTLSLFDLTHRFRLAEIVGKLINVYPDLPNKKLMESSVFKALVSGDPITAEYKYLNPFTFRSFAKLIFSTNKMPLTEDISPAFFRRWLIIDFPYTFKGKDRDTGLFEKLTTAEELEGLLQLAIQGLHTLHKTQEFQTSDSMSASIGDYERMNNPVVTFIEERCKIGQTMEIKKADLHKAFLTFTVNEELPSLGRNDFAKALKSKVPSIREVRDRSKKWRGIALID